MVNRTQDLSIDKLGRQARSTAEKLKLLSVPESCMPTEPRSYIIRKIKNGHPYYYRAVMVRDATGKRKQKILAYLGTRKPRDFKEPKRTIV